MVSAPGSPVLAPPKGPAVDVFYVHGGGSWISVSARQEVRHQCFFVVMVGAPGSPAPPPKGGTIDVL
jgi:hypothetical protein